MRVLEEAGLPPGRDQPRARVRRRHRRPCARRRELRRGQLHRIDRRVPRSVEEDRRTTSTGIATTRASSGRPAARTPSSPTPRPTPRHCSWPWSAARSSTRARSARPHRAPTCRAACGRRWRAGSPTSSARSRSATSAGTRPSWVRSSTRRRCAAWSRPSRRRRSCAGHRILTGGTVRPESGWFVDPTVFVTEDPTSFLMSKEFFGPLLTVHVYDDADWDKVLHQVDTASEYALTCSIFASDRARDRHRAGRPARHRRHDLRQRQAHRRADRPPSLRRRPRSGTNDKVGSPLALQRWVNARFVKENFAPAARLDLPVHGPVIIDAIAVRRHRRRPGRRRHRVEPRPPRARGDAGGADPPAARDGSSHGSARIFRYAYPDAFYARSSCGQGGLRRAGAAQRTPADHPVRCAGLRAARDPRALAAGPRGGRRRARAAQRRRRPGTVAADRRRQRDALAPGRRRDRRRGHGARAARAGRAPRRSALAPTGRSPASGHHGAGYRLATGDGRTLDAERIVVTAGGWLPALLDRLPLPARLPRAPAAAAGQPGERLPLPLPGRCDALLADVHPQEFRDPDLRPARRPRRRVPRAEDRRVRRRAKDRLGRRPGRRSSTRRTGARVVEYVRRTCPDSSPSPTPRRPACSPAPRPRTSSSTASTASRWSRPAPGTAPSSRR